MKNLFKFFAPVLFAVAAACSGGGGGGPGDVVEDFNMALAEGDVDAAIEHIQPSQRDAVRPKLEMVAPMAASQLEAQGGIDSIEVTNEEISEDGNTATVSYTVTFGNGETSEDQDTLTMVDGTWYVGMEG
ncbi:DUF4878 domain-containing protein [uncultured Parasphingopyxis sp.]|uniref:DUF4878 domain-containing protein n=1 Tax=uncultured Parasphingopyxis sp. TaxID=1547918 RepID=UPI00261828AC|nr:DUF4878 domain-containing protein [uncultured Parasphingopyxis sp.]